MIIMAKCLKLVFLYLINNFGENLSLTIFEEIENQKILTSEKFEKIVYFKNKIHMKIF